MTAKRKPHKYFRTGGYSREFTPKGEGKNYLLTRIPEDLWRQFRAKCRSQRVTLRAQLLTLVRDWLK